MSSNTLNAALRRLGYAKDEISVSGFRATASTLLNEMGRWNPDLIERRPARRGRTTWAYMHAAEFRRKCVEMMQVWADHLDQLKYGQPILRFAPSRSSLAKLVGEAPARVHRLGEERCCGIEGSVAMARRAVRSGCRRG
jgi:hypothetical protein